jgi:hypothetical protein
MSADDDSDTSDLSMMSDHALEELRKELAFKEETLAKVGADESSDTSDLFIMSDLGLDQLREISGRKLEQRSQQESEQDLEPEDAWPDGFYYPTDSTQEEGDDGSPPPSDDDGTALSNEYRTKNVQIEEDDDSQRPVAGGVVLDPIVAQRERTYRKSVMMSRVIFSEKKRVTFADSGSSDNDRSELRGDYGESGGNEDAGSGFDGEADKSKGTDSGGGNETGEDEDDDHFEQLNLMRRKELVNASLKIQTTSPATASASTSPLAVSPPRRSTRILARQEAEAVAQISDEDSLLSDAGSIPENLDVNSALEAAQSECEPTVRSTQTKATPEKESVKQTGPLKKAITSTKPNSLDEHDTQRKASTQHTRNKTSSSRKASRPSAKKKNRLREKPAAAVAELEDQEQTNTLTTSTAHMCDAIADLLTSSFRVCHQFMIYTSERDGVAAGIAAETAFTKALQKDERSRARRKRERDSDMGAKDYAPSKKPKNK